MEWVVEDRWWGTIGPELIGTGAMNWPKLCPLYPQPRKPSDPGKCRFADKILLFTQNDISPFQNDAVHHCEVPSQGD